MYYGLFVYFCQINNNNRVSQLKVTGNIEIGLFKLFNH